MHLIHALGQLFAGPLALKSSLIAFFPQNIFMWLKSDPLTTLKSTSLQITGYWSFCMHESYQRYDPDFILLSWVYLCRGLFERIHIITQNPCRYEKKCLIIKKGDSYSRRCSSWLWWAHYVAPFARHYSVDDRGVKAGRFMLGGQRSGN